MAYSHSRRHHPEVLKGVLCPLEQLIPLLIPFVFQLNVLQKSVCGSEEIYLDGVVDYQVHRNDRIHLSGVLSPAGHLGAHGCQVHNGGNAREVLHEYAGGLIGNFLLSCILLPVENGFQMLIVYGEAVVIPDDVFQEYAYGEWQFTDLHMALFFELLKADIF